MIPRIGDAQVFRVMRTDLGDYTVSTIRIDETDSIPFYETVIFSTSRVPWDKDILNGKKTSCVMQRNATRMHESAVNLVKIAYGDSKNNSA